MEPLLTKQYMGIYTLEELSFRMAMDHINLFEMITPIVEHDTNAHVGYVVAYRKNNQ